MTSQAGQMLSHYRLIEKIGEGGMGVVWKAEDAILKRPVAIKILPPNAARDDVRRRMFLEEARLASSLTDAHIAQVHELGREGDLDFIVMELVEGKPLSRILHGRPLPPDKVASLGLQVAQALARAHRKGLLHRDLKPGNILVTPEGEVKVVDFGLATLLGPRDTSILSDASTQTTEASSWRAGEGKGAGAALVGTLPYMSPEQARGEKLDARSDIFSLGVVLYEMTTGQRPFSGATGAELLREIASARSRPPHELVGKLPLEMDRIIQKTLAPAKANRYQTMEDLGVDLKRLGRDLETGSSPTYEDLKETPTPERHRMKMWILSGTFLAPVVAAGLWLLGPWRMGGADARTILILPMEIRGQADGADYLGRAFAEAIAVNLVQSKELRVLPVPAAGPEGKSDALGPAKAAREVGAGRLLTGALTRDGSIVHAGLSLLDAQENRILWGAQREAAGSSLPALAASLAQEVATALGARPRSLYDHFMNPTGDQNLVNSTEMTEALGALRRWEAAPALEATRRLVEAFPNEPEARALHIWALCVDDWLLPVALPPSSPMWKEMEESLANLQRLDPNSPWHDFLQAWWSFDETGRGREAIEVYTRVLQRDDLTPAARAFILSFRGNVHTILGDTAAGVADLEEALRLDPANDSIYAIHAADLNNAGRYSGALTFARQAVALNPTDDYNQSMLSWALRGLGRWEESLAPSAKACELRRGQGNCAWYAVALQGAGRAHEAQEKARDAAALTDSSRGARALACYWALVGNRSEALRLLRRALELGIADFQIIREPIFKPFHGDPEFERILAEAKRPHPSPPR